MTNQVLECAQCGAPLPETAGKENVRCTYCNTVNKMNRKPAPVVSTRSSARLKYTGDGGKVSETKPVGVLKILIILLLLGGGIAAAVVFLYEPFHVWDGYGGPPACVEVGGQTLMIGRVRLVRNDDQLYIQGTWAKTGKKAWRYGPMGDYAAGSTTVRYAVTGGQLVVAGPRSELTVINPATGKAVYQAQMSDSASKLCITNDPATILVEQVDKRRVFLHVPSGKLTEYTGGTFPSCLQVASGSVEADQGELQPEPALQGHRLMRTWRDSNYGISVLKKDPGTPLPMVAGFVPTTGQVTWQAPLSLVDPVSIKSPGTNDFPGDLIGVRFVVAYAVGSEKRRLACFDVRNGNRLWDVELNELFAVDWINLVSVYGEFAFVQRTSSLDIISLTNGELIDTVGDDTYE